jgi:hypothetical protein
VVERSGPAQLVFDFFSGAQLLADATDCAAPLTQSFYLVGLILAQRLLGFVVFIDYGV